MRTAELSSLPIYKSLRQNAAACGCAEGFGAIASARKRTAQSASLVATHRNPCRKFALARRQAGFEHGVACAALKCCPHALQSLQQSCLHVPATPEERKNKKQRRASRRLRHTRPASQNLAATLHTQRSTARSLFFISALFSCKLDPLRSAHVRTRRSRARQSRLSPAADLKTPVLSKTTQDRAPSRADQSFGTKRAKRSLNKRCPATTPDAPLRPSHASRNKPQTQTTSSTPALHAAQCAGSSSAATSQRSEPSRHPVRSWPPPARCARSSEPSRHPVRSWPPPVQCARSSSAAPSQHSEPSRRPVRSRGTPVSTPSRCVTRPVSPTSGATRRSLVKAAPPRA